MAKKKESKHLDFSLVGRDNVNEYNRQLILSLFKGGKALARRDIVALTGMRQGTMQVHVEDLLAEEFLIETGPGESKAGRRPQLLQINSKRFFIVGGYFKADRVELVLADLQGKVITRHTEYPTVENDRSHLLLALGRGLIHLIEGRGRRDDILGISLGVPGSLNVRDQILTHAHFGSWWKGIELGRYIRTQFGCRSWVDNDIRLATLAEGRFGVCSDVSNFLFVSVDDQLQVGAMIGGRVYAGHDGMAGRMGHMCVNPDGLLCSCGNRGCLNTVATNPALIDIYQKLNNDDKLQITVEEIVEQARGDKTAAKYALETIARALGLGLANLANLFNPEKIVIAGQVSLAGELFLFTANQVILERTIPPISNFRLEWSQIADQATGMGAVAVALDEFFALPIKESPLSLTDF